MTEVWVKYGEDEVSIDIRDWQYVSHLKEKIHVKFGLSVPAPKLIVKWKGQTLSPRTKISSLDLSGAEEEEESFIVEIPN